MGGAFLRAMAMKISQSEAFFDALSSRQVKTRLHRVKMMSYDENIKKSKNFEKSIFSFFVPMALGKPPEPPEPPESRRAARKLKI